MPGGSIEMVVKKVYIYLVQAGFVFNKEFLDDRLFMLPRVEEGEARATFGA